MVSLLLGSLVVVSVAAGASLSIFLIALRLGWFAVLRRGFFVTLVLPLLGIGLFAVWLSGAWGYRASRRIVFDEVVLALKNVGDIVERQIENEMDEAFLQLHHLAAELPADRLTRVPALDLVAALREVTHVNTRFLQLDLIIAPDRRLATTSVVGGSTRFSHVAVAYCLDGNQYASDPRVSSAYQREKHLDQEHMLELCVPVKSSGIVVGALAARFDVQDLLIDLLTSARFNQSGTATLVGSDGHVLADAQTERLNEDVSGSEAVRKALGGATGVSTISGKGPARLAFYRPVRNPATINPKPWALLTEIDQAEAVTPLNALASQIGTGLLGIAIASVFVAWAVSWSITLPVSELVAFARRVQGGDLTAQARVTGRDAHGQLGDALNTMVHGLRERDRVKEVFGRYVARQVSEKVLQGEFNLGGERRCVTILFSDIRNFTAMAESLPPEQIVEFLNDYFSEMVEAVFEQGGMLDKFIGDGLMAVFGATDDGPDHAQRAVRAALHMKSLLAKINGERAMRGRPPIAVGIGVHTDEVIVGNIGSRKRLEYTVIGDGVNISSRLESMNKELGTTILISDTTYQAVKDQFVCHAQQSVLLRGKSKELAAYEVVSIAGAARADS